MKLIDADKLLYDLANEDVPSHIHSWVLDEIERGKYDPDTNPAREMLPDHVMELLKQNSRYKLNYGGKKYLIRQVITSIEKL